MFCMKCGQMEEMQRESEQHREGERYREGEDGECSDCVICPETSNGHKREPVCQDPLGLVTGND